MMTLQTNFLNAIKSNIVWNVASLKGIFWMVAGRMDRLIDIQANRIAPAVEGIAARDFNFNISVNSPVTVNASSGSSASEIGTQVVQKIGTEILKVVKKGLSTNELGIRTAIEKI